MTVAVPPASASEALGMLTSAMSYLATADATQMAAEVQAACLRGLEQATAVGTVARSSILGAFAAGQGYCEDGAYSPRSWLIHQTRVTKGAAAGHTAWVRRARAHPRIGAAMAAGELSESWARMICGWTEQLPEDCRDNADAILAGAAYGGLDLRDLAELAAEMQARSQPDNSDDDNPGLKFEDRSVRLEITFDGAGVVTGDLTPECSAVIRAVLDALSAPRGAADTRSHEQRYHDAMDEAMRRLVTAGLVPERAGQPAKVIAHIALPDLVDLDVDAKLRQEWAERVRGRWAAHRAAAASVSGSDGGAWLDGDAARAFACDASITPVVTGEVNPTVLEDLVRHCLELAGYGTCGTGPHPPTARGRDALEQEIIRKAVALVSGPGGLASFLRRRTLGGRLGGPSLPLDVGVSRDIPAAIRTAVIQRDQHCRFPDGCDQPASACEIHHTTPQANGGKTSVEDCGMFFHHHVVIHLWGWTVVLNPDGTTTAYSPDKKKILHSHGPPAPPGNIPGHSRPASTGPISHYGGASDRTSDRTSGRASCSTPAPYSYDSSCTGWPPS